MLVLLMVALITLFSFIMLSIDTKPTPSPAASTPALMPVQKVDANTPEQGSNRQIQQYYAQRLGQLQAESIRLKALTERIAEMAGIDTTVFELENTPAQGGNDITKLDNEAINLEQELEQLSSSFKISEQDLVFLQKFYITNNSIQSAIPHSSPSEEGWVSSYYGKRIDPFNGKTAFHHGIDIAGRQGSAILAVADGIITWTGRRSGYGQLVEIDHGNGYVTRYAHNKELVAQLGDRVTTGQTIALMGSTGRSTGPHVHYEVLLDGRPINPYNFIKG